MIYEIYRISLHIAVFVQRLAVCDAAIYDISVDKAFDRLIYLPLYRKSNSPPIIAILPQKLLFEDH